MHSVILSTFIKLPFVIKIFEWRFYRFYCSFSVFSTEVCNHLAEEERAACFTLIVFLLSYGGLCSVSLSRGVVGWSTDCNCKISRLYAVNLRKTVHSKIDKTKILMTNGSLVKVESIAECFLEAFCNTFDLH